MGRKAKRKHHSLTGRITVELMAKAFKAVKKNRGAAGVDRVSINAYEKNLGRNLDELMRLMKQRRFQPKPNRRVFIPKTAGKNAPKRPLGIPTVRDRTAQEVIRQLIEPIFEPLFHPNSHGFRPKRGCHTAVKSILEAKNKGLKVVVDADIKAFFDNIPHEVIMKALGQQIADGNILTIIEKFLGAGVLEDGKIIDTAKGTPQGGVISPLLANIVLNQVDWALDEAGLEFVRYADDLVILCRSLQQAEKALALLRKELSKIGLALNEEKTNISSFKEHFDFLGFTFKPNAIAIRKKAQEKFKDEVRMITKRTNGKSIQQTIELLNPLLRGTANYYAKPYTNVRYTLDRWDRWVRHRLRYHKFRRTRLGFKQRRRTTNKWFARKGLISMHALALSKNVEKPGTG